MIQIRKHAGPLAALGLAALISAAGAPARAAELCGWLTETADAEKVHEFSLWLEADANVAFFYKMTGKGVVSEGMKAYSPGSGTFSLRPKAAEKAWGFGTSLSPPAEIDIVAEIHAPPKSVFDEAETPLLARFVFQRHVSEDEKKPPTEFARRQCATLPASR
jgi:hypothetical protein